uniref:Uncharacterized protein n=1 Tax=Aegilops tauschii subsp. strangulata TaxID=200361 RepID=A0A453SN06_AEGTS
PFIACAAARHCRDSDQRAPSASSPPFSSSKLKGQRGWNGRTRRGELGSHDGLLSASPPPPRS